MSADTYMHWWGIVFSTVLLGMWSKVIATGLLILAGWFGLRTRNLGAMFVMLLLSALVAFGSPLFKLLSPI